MRKMESDMFVKPPCWSYLPTSKQLYPRLSKMHFSAHSYAMAAATTHSVQHELGRQFPHTSGEEEYINIYDRQFHPITCICKYDDMCY